ncbi:tRNA (adenosine(37)-N6)-threonylcarbamoyltransferase complex ATPase subunit type 1 TsaE [Arthrobacter castelli]|uniref:tRNA (adenosine(37)-N6)-threonylcarbamoyltransferase complex ATPase subunit type 1 TsaE n=1 Tax=Arthrobacter castelli TaxID=271431 RepID=UPI000423D87D|nr:tRNA (adenosine(37)-N6)-threonylcarbamoyltransferase complex ATPase subunit type 1 TsaE [Arthrobacter castelli]
MSDGDTPVWELEAATFDVGHTQAFAARLGAQLRAGDLIVLSGELGAGKTVFTQGLGAGLGVRAGIISPTFVLVRIHPNLTDGPRPGGPALVHVDAYRLGSAAEIDDIDLENTLDSSVTVVEWGEDRVEHLTDSRLDIALGRSEGAAAAPDGDFHHNGAQDAGGQDGVVTDFDQDDDDEARLIRITAYGPRWAGQKPVLPVD